MRNSFIKDLFLSLMEDVAAFIADFKMNALYILLGYIIDKYIIGVKKAIQFWLFDEFTFATFFIIMLVCDFLAYVNKLRTSNKGMRISFAVSGVNRFFDNVVKYGIALIAIHGLSKYSVNGVTNTWFADAPNWFFAFCMLRVATNIFRNLGFDVSLIIDKISEKFKDFKVKDTDDTNQ